MYTHTYLTHVISDKYYKYVIPYRLDITYVGVDCCVRYNNLHLFNKCEIELILLFNLLVILIYIIK